MPKIRSFKQKYVNVIISSFKENVFKVWFLFNRVIYNGSFKETSVLKQSRLKMQFFRRLYSKITCNKRVLPRRLICSHII